MNGKNIERLVELNVELITEFETMRQTVKAIYETLKAVKNEAREARATPRLGTSGDIIKLTT